MATFGVFHTLLVCFLIFIFFSLILIFMGAERWMIIGDETEEARPKCWKLTKDSRNGMNQYLW